MSSWFSPKDMKQVDHAEDLAFRSPVPTRMVSNGEYMPAPQTREQREVEDRIKASSELLARTLGQSRRQFLQTSMGMATAFVAMNQVFGNIFHVDAAEARDPAAAAERAAMLSSEFIFDDQTHHVHDTFSWKGILFLREYASGKNPEGKAWNPALASEKLPQPRGHGASQSSRGHQLGGRRDRPILQPPSVFRRDTGG